jgi:hypothetical protein
MPSCCAGGVGHGPGFATPLEAHRHGERERLAYIPVTSFDHARPDYLATVDLDPSSPTHAQARARAQRRSSGAAAARGCRCSRR